MAAPSDTRKRARKPYQHSFAHYFFLFSSVPSGRKDRNIDGRRDREAGRERERERESGNAQRHQPNAGRNAQYVRLLVA